MSTARFVTVAVVLGSALCSAACAGPPAGRAGAAPKARPRRRSARPERSTSSARRAGRRRLPQARRRRASWSTRAGRSRFRTIGASARSAELPWTRTTTSGSITGRGRSTRARPARCRESATNEQGVPISALGHPRPYAERSTGCCVPAPSVLKFDREGNLLAAWGGPSDPGFLDENCREADGCFWPAREHGIFVDHNDFVYVSGNGEDGGSRQQQGVATYPWAPSFGDDSHILKFTADGTFVYQIGTAGMDGPNSEKIDGGPNGTPQPYLVADMSVDAEDEPPLHRGRLRQSTHPDRGCRDGTVRRSLRCVRTEPRRRRSELGRGRHRRRPVDRRLSGRQHETLVLPQPDALRHREPRWLPLRLRSRQQPRADLRARSGGFGQAVCEPERRAGQVRLRRRDARGPADGERHVRHCDALHRSRRRRCLYVGDLANGTLYIINRENLTELDRIGRAGRQAGEFHWLHALAVDSHGDIYTGEVDTGQRVQKFLRYGSSSCSGTGSAEVGLYSANR